MGVNYWTYITLGIYVIALLYIGFYSYKQSKNLDGYMLGGRNLSALTTALSAGASDMSGWLLMGLPGALYLTGISAIWIAIGLIIGSFLNYVLVAPRLRVYTHIAKNSITIPDFLENRFHDRGHGLRIISGLIILVFFTLYTAAGVVSGGVLFQKVFNLNYELGVIITAIVVVIYTYFGGFLAVSLADLMQGAIMFTALLLVPFTILWDIGIINTFQTIDSIDPKYLDLFTGTSVISIISLISWGLGYFGQPHIILRFMAIRRHQELAKARNIGSTWMFITLLGAAATGLFGIAYLHLHKQSITDPETIFIFLSQVMFHPVISGFLLSAILAAIMSTIAAQLLITSSALTKDFYQLLRIKSSNNPQISDQELVIVGRISVLVVAILSCALAWNKLDSIIHLVGNAWSGFGASFGPVILLSLFWSKFTRNGAMAGMISGGITTIIWIIFKQFNTGIYEIIPGFIVCSIVSIVVSKSDKAPNPQIIQEFLAMKEELNSKN